MHGELQAPVRVGLHLWTDLHPTPTYFCSFNNLEATRMSRRIPDFRKQLGTGRIRPHSPRIQKLKPAPCRPLWNPDLHLSSQRMRPLGGKQKRSSHAAAVPCASELLCAPWRPNQLCNSVGECGARKTRPRSSTGGNLFNHFKEKSGAI